MKNGWECTAPYEHYTSDHPLVVCNHYVCRSCIEDKFYEEFSCTVCNLDLKPWIELMMEDEQFWEDEDGDDPDEIASEAETETEDEN